MIDALMKILRIPNKAPSRYPIVVSQYERDGYSANDPEQLHWAIIVLVDEDDQKGPCWQAIDVYYRDGRVEWKMPVIREEVLGKTTKCLGGVIVGYVPSKQLDDLEKVVVSNSPTIKFAGWNCRDWVMEVIGMLRKHEWVEIEIPGQAILFPPMKD
ncbi:hypothetical protein C0991_007492 [Blastosporella zonata]|nr:hypothetical protein C0991_007492 [Blastosporella zonata]